jgi:TP901 family phage tail tape measure protein
MAFNIKYIYDLKDLISPQLKKIKNNIDRSSAAIKKNASVFKRSTDIMKKGLSGVKNAAVGLTSGIKGMVVGFLGIQAARGGVGVIVDFGTAMSKVKAVTKATGDEMKLMRKLARDLGETTEFTAGQAGQGMAFLGMAGFETTEILKAMPAVLDLATAGQLGLAEASDISSNIMSGFNIKAEEMVRVSDSMSIVAAAANTNIFQLGDAMKFVGPVAASAGISLEKSAAAIGVLSDAGLQGTMAGTGLRRIISELASPTKAAQRELAKIGLSLEDVNPQTNELTDILEKLKPLAKDTGASFRVFGDRGAPAFQVLAKGIPKVKELNKAMLEGQGAAAKMANTMRDNLGGDIKGLFSAIQGLVLMTGEEGLTGTLRRSTQGLTMFFRALSGNKDAMSELGEFAKLLVKILGFLGKILSISAGGLNTLLNAVGGVANKAIGLFSGEDENITTNINQNQNSNLQGNLDVNFNNIPKGSSVSTNIGGNTDVNLGTNLVFAGG